MMVDVTTTWLNRMRQTILGNGPSTGTTLFQSKNLAAHDILSLSNFEASLALSRQHSS
jgi:hypothetical protein